MTDARVERRLAAILAADVVGFSALMERDEEGTYARVGRLRREIIEPRLSDHQGRLIKTTGDGFLAEFASPIAALRCALAIQGSSSNAPDALRLRIGLNLGDVIIEEGGDIYGEGVNVAARLEALADPGGILISGKIYSEVEGKVEAAFEDRGEQQVKNITRPVRIYVARSAGAAGPSAATILSQLDSGKSLTLPDKPSVAVLPFQNMSCDPEQEYFADGMVEDIITELSRFRSLFVIARNSTFTYKGKSVDVRQVARELGVRYVLEGSTRKVGNRIRVTAQLIDPHSGAHVWAEKYDRVLEDIFAVQEEITRQIVAAIAPELEAAELAKLRNRRLGSLQAYELALMARSFGIDAYAHSDVSLRNRAVTLAEEAIAIDPNNVEAVATLASLHWQHAMFRTGISYEASIADALAAARRTIALDRTSYQGYLYKGMVHLITSEPDEALADVREAHRLNPNEAFTLASLGWIEGMHHEIDASIKHQLEALRLSPRDPFRFNFYTGLSVACFAAEDYAKGVEWGVLSERECPEFPTGLMYLAANYAAHGQKDLAKATVDKLHRLAPTFLAVRLDPAFKGASWKRPEDRERLNKYLRIAAGLETERL